MRRIIYKDHVGDREPTQAEIDWGIYGELSRVVEFRRADWDDTPVFRFGTVNGDDWFELHPDAEPGDFFDGRTNGRGYPLKATLGYLKLHADDWREVGGPLGPLGYLEVPLRARKEQ